MPEQVDDNSVEQEIDVGEDIKYCALGCGRDYALEAYYKFEKILSH